MMGNELYDIIIRECQLDNANNDVKKSIVAYLTGEIDTIHLTPKKMNYYYTIIFETLVKELDGDNYELAKRGLYVCYQLYPDRFFSGLQYNERRFFVYQTIGVSKNSVFNEIADNIQRSAQYYGNTLQKKISDWKADLHKDTDRTYAYTEMFTYYGDIVENILNETTTIKSKIKMTQAILTVLSFIWYYEDEEKRKNYLPKMENFIFGMLKDVFHQGFILKDLEKMSAAETLEFFKKTQKADMPFGNNYESRTTLGLCSLIYQESPLLRDAYKISLIECDIVQYMSENDFSMKDMQRLYDELGMTAEESIKLYAKLLFDNIDESRWKQYTAALNSYVTEQEDYFYSAFETLKKKNHIAALILGAVLIKHQKGSDELLEYAEKQMLSTLKQFDKNSNSGSRQGFAFQCSQENVKGLDNLLEETLDCTNAEFISRYNESLLGHVITCACALYDYSICARNIVSLGLSSFSFRNGYGIQMFQRIYPCFSSTDENIYELLAKTAGVKKVLCAFIETGGIKSGETAFKEFMKNHIDETKALLNLLPQYGADFVISFIDLYFSKEMESTYSEVVFLLEHKQKTVLNYLESFLLDKEKEIRAEVEVLLKSKNKNTRETVMRIIRAWDEEKINERLKKIATAQDMTVFVKEKYQKPKKLPYQEILDWNSVRFADSEEKAEPIVLEYYLTEYMLLKELRILPSCEKIKGFLNQGDFKRFIKSLYGAWLENGADTKEKNILLPYALSCDGGDIPQLKKQIDTWTENARGALAAFAVTAMALNGSDIALLLTEGISKKYKNKQVKGAAADALEKVAAQYHMTKEELGDKIVPDLGFDKNREKWLDYGSRKFKCLLNEKLEVTLMDEKGKVIKSLPKPNANDDTVLAEEAKEELKGLKKQLKTVVSTQKTRLESALMISRRWTKEKWIQLFVDNPIMNSFAIGLIWTERDNDGQLLGTYRYMEDGSFNTADEEEYFLSENTSIELLHPLDIENETLEQWRQQLEDYEILQPITQLSMPVYNLEENEKDMKQLTRFEKKKVYFGTIKGVMEKYDWRRTAILDAGGYEGYYYENKAFDVGVCLYFEDMYVGMMSNDIVEMKEMEFYKCDTVSFEDYCYVSISEKNRVLPKDVPEKLINFALMVGESIAQKEIK